MDPETQTEAPEQPETPPTGPAHETPEGDEGGGQEGGYAKALCRRTPSRSGDFWVGLLTRAAKRERLATFSFATFQKKMSSFKLKNITWRLHDSGAESTRA